MLVMAQCKKSRSFGVRSKVRHGLGELEPYAFLGAWLESRGDVDSKAEHVAWTPSAADVFVVCPPQARLAGVRANLRCVQPRVCAASRPRRNFAYFEPWSSQFGVSATMFC